MHDLLIGRSYCDVVGIRGALFGWRRRRFRLGRRLDGSWGITRDVTCRRPAIPNDENRPTRARLRLQPVSGQQFV